jgi:DNA-binding NtrC family response regulator
MKRSILVVDDELHILTLLERILAEKTPYHVTTTHNALEVPDILRSRTFDVLITDIRMPGLDGMDLLRMIRDNNRSEEVIIITAFESLETALEAFALNACDYITKPFKRERLLSSVEAAIRRQEMRRQAKCLAGMLDCEQFEKAVKRFKSEFIERAASRVGRDPHEIARLTGLSPDEIAEALGEDE